MSSQHNTTGIILAGGKSSRMGQEKGLLLLKGKPFVQHIIEALQPLVKEILIVSSTSDYDKFEARRIEDIIVDSGPLAGLHAGLTHSCSTHNLVISCDAPLITTSLLKSLLPRDNETYDIIQFEANTKAIPLIAFYKKHCADHCATLLSKGEKRLRQLTKKLHTKTIEVIENDIWFVQNINTLEELNAITHEVNY